MITKYQTIRIGEERFGPAHRAYVTRRVEVWAILFIIPLFIRSTIVEWRVL